MNQSIVNQIILSYLGGAMAFLSPCLIPSLLAYLSFVAGSAVLGRRQGRGARIVWTSLLFGIGFSLLFGIGIIPSPVQVFLVDAYQTNARITSVAAIAFGLTFVFRSNGARRRDDDESTDLAGAPLGLPGAFMLGALFGAVWPHCLGPILGAILDISTVPWSAARGTLLIIIYVLGLITSFGLAGLVLRALPARFLNRSSRDQRLTVLKGSGIVLTAIGVSLFFTEMWLEISRIFIGLANNYPLWRVEELLLRLLR